MALNAYVHESNSGVESGGGRLISSFLQRNSGFRALCPQIQSIDRNRQTVSLAQHHGKNGIFQVLQS